MFTSTSLPAFLVRILALTAIGVILVAIGFTLPRPRRSAAHAAWMLRVRRLQRRMAAGERSARHAGRDALLAALVSDF